MLWNLVYSISFRTETSQEGSYCSWNLVGTPRMATPRLVLLRAVWYIIEVAASEKEQDYESGVVEIVWDKESALCGIMIHRCILAGPTLRPMRGLSKLLHFTFVCRRLLFCESLIQS